MIEYSYSFAVRLRDGETMVTKWESQMATHDQTLMTIYEHVHAAMLEDLRRAAQAGGLWDLGMCDDFPGPMAIHPNQIAWVGTLVTLGGPETAVPPASAGGTGS